MGPKASKLSRVFSLGIIVLVSLTKNANASSITVTSVNAEPSASVFIGPTSARVEATSGLFQSIVVAGTVESTANLLVDWSDLNLSGAGFNMFIVTITPDANSIISNLLAFSPAFYPNYLPNKAVLSNQITYSGGLVPAGGRFETRFTFDVTSTSTSGDFSYTISTNTAPGVVPEPATLTLVALGGLALRRRKRYS